MKYAEERTGGSADFIHWNSEIPVSLDPEVRAIYDSNYTTFLALDDVESDDLRKAVNDYYNAWSVLSRWRGYSKAQFVEQANERDEEDWEPGKQVIQAYKFIPNPAYVLEAFKEVFEVIGEIYDPLTPAKFETKQDYRNHYPRNIEGLMDEHLWDIYDGIDEDYMQELYEKVMSPHEGGWKD